MFRFFPEEDEESKKGSEGSSTSLEKVDFKPCRQIDINQVHYSLVSYLKQNKPCDVKVSTKITLQCVNLGDLSSSAVIEKNADVQNILKSTSDLVSGVYEGGFKTWECTFDLISYLEANFLEVFTWKCSGSGGDGDNKRPLRILDLGCGSGLLGLFVLKLAKERGIEIRVDFQDYNEEVINYVTIPNTLLNCDDEDAAKCRYFSGDWDSFTEVANNSQTEAYDVILSSETIYNLEYFPKFIRVLKSSLRKGGGCLYLAAKTFYFGVGGGTRAFLGMVSKEDDLEGSVSHVIKQGVQREILCVRFRS